VTINICICVCICIWCEVKVTALLQLRKLHFSTSVYSTVLARSSKLMVDGDSMGPGLQLVRARFSNLLLGKLSREFKLCRMSWNSNGHALVVRGDTVRWLGMLVVLHVLCMLMWLRPDPASRSRPLTLWSSENPSASRGYNLVIVIACRPQHAMHAGGDDRQPPFRAFYC